MALLIQRPPNGMLLGLVGGAVALRPERSARPAQGAVTHPGTRAEKRVYADI